MNIREFNKELKNINDSSWGYGNEILYCMTKDSNDLQDKDKLAGAIWLIGRAYAASPQRRSYGTMDDNLSKYIKADGNLASKCPIWPVRTQNDGREGFFDEIAANIITNLDFKGWMSNHLGFSEPYNYDRSNTDIDKLTKSIVSVLQFNLILSKALEEFDEVPSKNVFGRYKVYCSNHISFSSKFLHFYFPHSIFIIDNFARDGGKLLFGGYNVNKPRGIYDPLNARTNPFDKTIYDEFNKADVLSIYDSITQTPTIKKAINEYDSRKRQDFTAMGDNSTVKDYIEHCIRSYLLGCYIVVDRNKANISPSNQIRYNKPYSIAPMPRLTDAILLNIKEPISNVLSKHYNSIKNIFKVKYIQIEGAYEQH